MKHHLYLALLIGELGLVLAREFRPRPLRRMSSARERRDNLKRELQIRRMSLRLPDSVQLHVPQEAGTKADDRRRMSGKQQTLEDKRHVAAERTGSFQPIKSFTTDFELYDVNKDGHVTLNELIHVTGRAGHVRRAFRASDFNGDGVVTEEEYVHLPWGYTDVK